AYPLEPQQLLEGRLGVDDEAWFVFDTGTKIRQWQLRTRTQQRGNRLEIFRPERLEMDVLTFNALYPGEDRAIAFASQAEVLEISNLRLLPGRYLVRLSGNESDYTLALTAGEHKAPGHEAEPNDLSRHANPLWLGEPVSGHFHRVHDEDYFQFHMPGWNRVRLTLMPPEEVDTHAWLQWDGETRYQNEYLTLHAKGEPQQASFWLSPGDRLLRLRGQQASETTYQARLELIPPWDLRDGVTPAPTPEQAPLIPRETRVSIGLQGKVVEQGYLRLPAGETQRELLLFGGVVTGEREPRGGQTWITLRTEKGGEIPLTRDTRSREHSATLPAGQPIIMQVRFGPNTQPVDIVDAQRPPPLPLDITLAADQDEVAAYLPHGQLINLQLDVTNPLDTTQKVSVVSHLSHEKAYLEGLPESIGLDDKSKQTFPLALRVPPGLNSGDSLVVFIRIGEHDVRLVLEISADAETVKTFAWPDAAQEYHGLTDLAWSGLGAAFIDPDTGEDVGKRWQRRNTELRALIDGLSSASALGWREMGEPLPPLRLAGDGGTLHALVFNQRSSHAVASRWRRVGIAAGNQLNDLQPIMEVELRATQGAQVFALDAPLEARYVQLHPLSVWGKPPGAGAITGTGMFRALGEPRGALAEKHHDLLSVDHGGHWLYTLPDLASLHGLLGQRNKLGQRGYPTEAKARQGERIRDRQIEMVFAFANQRAARLKALHWQDDPEWSGHPVERVQLYAASESPTGPWTLIANHPLERDESGKASIPLSEKPWVRYLKLAFEEPVHDADERQPRWRIPRKIIAIEADTLGSGQSILGYWGLDTYQGPMEKTVLANSLLTEQEGEVSALSKQLTDHSPLDNDYEVLSEGIFSQPGDTRQTSLVIEEGQNHLQLWLRESLRGRLNVRLTNEEGNQYAIHWQNKPGGRLGQAPALEAGEYQLTISKPPSSIVFIWDGSGSVAHHQTAIYQALERFAEGIKPGQEVFNLMAMGGPLLLEEWADTPAMMAMGLGHYDQRFLESDSEPALRMATRALEQQPGEKIIFLITDAEVVERDIGVWEDLIRVRPRIHSLSIGHGDQRQPDELRWYQDLMQAWARVGDGQYRYATGRSDLVAAFEEAMREARDTVSYRLDGASGYQAPPEPGRIQITRGEAPVIGAGAVQLIFDASGSMLKPMEGGRRIEVARNMVEQVLESHIPDHVPVALRAFGHTEPHSCATELLVPAASGSHALVRDSMAEIQAVNLARTPLADSLFAVTDDLAAYADQPRLVVMLTDGEETCDGNLQDAIERLQASGIEITLNIVGLEIEDPSLQAQFSRLATQAGGVYFDSQDDQQLQQGLQAALAAPWWLVDDNELTVASGRVDQSPIEVEAGEYRLIVGSKARDGQLVRIEPGQLSRISLD
ncbi:MAG: VWA domain-containing protein, partial [Pseudomonadota bacterium]